MHRIAELGLFSTVSTRGERLFFAFKRQFFALFTTFFPKKPYFCTVRTKLESWVDLGVCLLLIPSLLSVFPLEEWVSWNAADVVVYLLWTYLCWYLGRTVLPRMIEAGKGRRWTGLILLFLTVVLTFLMSLRQVAFPQEVVADRPPRLYLYQQAVWVLYTAAMGCGLATGFLVRKIRRLEAVRETVQEEESVRSAVETRALPAVAGESISVKADYKDVTVPLAAIQYIESRNNYACLHLDHQEDIVSQITLKSLLEQLPEGKFIRIHRSYIVPVHRIEHKTATSVKLIGVDKPLPVGRAHKENLK